MVRAQTDRARQAAERSRDGDEMDARAGSNGADTRRRDALVARAGGNAAIQYHARSGTRSDARPTLDEVTLGSDEERSDATIGDGLCSRCRRRLRLGLPLDCPTCAASLERRPSGGGASTEVRIRPSLPTRRPNERPEREAERIADRFTRSENKAGSGTAGFELPQGKAVRRHTAPATGVASSEAGVSDLGRGRPLTGAERRRYESFFGADLSSVRLHMGERARRSADELDADAYATGDRIVFGGGGYDATRAGRRLLAHELAHVVFHDTQSGVRRTPNGEGDEIEYDPCRVDVGSLTNAALLNEWGRVEKYLDARERGEDEWYDYANLMRRLGRERKARVRQGHIWLAEEGLRSVPAQLYELRSAGGRTIRVVKIDSSQERGAPRRRTTSSVLTPGQFDDFLSRQDIPDIDAREFFARQAALPEERREPLEFQLPLPDSEPMAPGGSATFGATWQQPLGYRSPFGVQPAGVSPFGPQIGPLGGEGGYDPSVPIAGMTGMTGSGLRASPFDIAARSTIAEPVYPSEAIRGDPRRAAGAEANWRGELPEKSMTSGTYRRRLRYVDLNRSQQNAPVFDVASRFGPMEVYSVYHSDPSKEIPDNRKNIRGKVRRMTGDNEPGKFSKALQLLDERYSGSTTMADVNTRNFLAVPDDQVPEIRQLMNETIAGPHARPSSYQNILDAMLREQPVEVDGVTYRSWGEVDRNRMGVDNYRKLREILGERLGNRVVGVGMTTPEMMALQEHRATAQQLGPGEYRMVASPELLESVRYRAQGMGTNAAYHRTARAGAYRGGGVAAVGSAVTGTGQLLLDESGNPQIVQTYAVDVPLGFAGGAGEAYLETQLGARFSQRAFQRATARGVSATAARGWAGVGALGRGFGSSLAGGIAAPAVTLTGMGLDEAFFGGEYTGIDYAAKGGRSAVSGGIAAGAGWLAAAGVGAAAGSWAPGVGTAVGFLVGAGAYFVADHFVGQEVEDAIREAAGERGCVNGVGSAGQ